MTLTFQQLDKQQAQHDQHTAKLQEIAERLEKFTDKFPQEIDDVKQLPLQFQKKVNDFYRNDRKLRIGIMGQVKAGKSSFLNALLFNGVDVLPKAATPKTANLTVVQYGEENQLEVEYYDENEWKELERLALETSEIDQVKVAREIMDLVHVNGINPYEYIGKGKGLKRVQSHEELLGVLNEYAGENGRFTPLVKSTSLYIHDERLKGIEIIDTPGMNDPIISRTEKTKQCMEYTDVVFFLSQTSAFLDQTDVDLLVRQLPAKGIAKLQVIASKYDSGILDVGWDCDSLEETEMDIRTRLTRHAKKTIETHVERLEERNRQQIADVLRNSIPPIFLSSVMHNLGTKLLEECDKHEVHIYEELTELWDDFEFTQDVLEGCSGFEELQQVFQRVIAEKDETLARKSAEFIPTSQLELAHVLESIENQAMQRIHLLQTKDLKQMEEHQNVAKQQINRISRPVEEIMSNITMDVERARMDALQQIRSDIHHFSNLTERTGTEEKTRSYTVSNSKWWNPFSWGSTRTEYTTYTTTYRYLDVSDAMQQLHHFVDEATVAIERVFNHLVDGPKVKHQLIQCLLENVDMSNERVDPEFFKLVIEKAINKIELPVFKLNVKDPIQMVASSFSGEVRGSDMVDLKFKLTEALRMIFTEVETTFVQEIKMFNEQLQNIRRDLLEQILKDVHEEFEKVKEDFLSKEQEMKVYESLVSIVRSLHTWKVNC